MSERIQAIQEQLREAGIDGWLLYDHHGHDLIAYRVVGWEHPGGVSRRWFYWIPAQGAPVGLASRIEPHRVAHLPGEQRHYSSWRELHQQLAALLAGAQTVAMQYSPDGMIPVVSLVDGGTVDLIRGLGKQVVSSAALVQYFEARWTDAQFEMHQEAGRRVDAVLDEAFARIGERIRSEGAVQENEIAQFIRDRFAAAGLVSTTGPTVAANGHAGDPHYHPTETITGPIVDGDFVLIDGPFNGRIEALQALCRQAEARRIRFGAHCRTRQKCANAQSA